MEILEEGLFDDYQDEVNENEEVTEENVVDEESSEPFLEVVYDKNPRNLTREEAIEYSQKGLNYDRLHTKYETLENDYNSMSERFKDYENTISKLNEYAGTMGMDVPTYLSRLEQLNTVAVARNEMAQLKSKYPNADESMLRDFATQLAKNRMAELADLNRKAKAEMAKKESESQSRQNQNIERMVDNFQKIYPDVDIERLIPEIADDLRNGYTLLEAYQMKLSKEHSDKEKIEKLNAENKKKSYGNTNSQGVTEDAFLSGFLGD